MQDPSYNSSEIYQLIGKIYELDSIERLAKSPDAAIAHQELLPTLQQHIEIAQQNHDRYTQLQSHLTQIQQILPYLNIISLAADGTIVHLAATAQSLLYKYFAQTLHPGSPLPLSIRQWLQSQQSKAIVPFSFLSQNHCLVIHLLPSNVAPRLVLSEQPALHLTPQSFEQIGLTPRESEILFYVAQGRENQTIGETLNIHPTTVKTHLSHITAKLSVDHRLAAVTVALKQIGIETFQLMQP
jgi:DNA-binding NarL/FixJ family response regulator